MLDWKMLPSERAPSLHRRRLVRVWAYPWGQLIVAGLLAFWSWIDGVDGLYAMTWLLLVGLCLIIEDVATRSSVLRSALHNRKEKGAGGAVRYDLADVNEAYSVVPEPAWFPHRVRYRWVAAVVLLAASWGYALALGLGADVSDPAMRPLLVTWAMLFPLVPMSVTLISRYTSDWDRNGWLIAGLSVFPFVVTALSMSGATSRLADQLFAGVCVAFAYVSAFTAKRLWTGEALYHEALHKISLDLLDQRDLSRIEDKVANLIRRYFRYDRVYILKKIPGKPALEITHCSGKCNDLIGYQAPLDESITGRAFVDRGPVVWNSTAACPYYLEVPALQDTRAEIAVPIMHQGEVFAVLDVQSVEGGVFGPTDTSTLVTIGRMLGAAMATHRQREVLQEVRNIWDELEEISQINPADDHEAFELFADFARRQFGAEPIVYFPLSYAGRPVHMPLTLGLREPEAMNHPADDEDSSLITLIDWWETEYISHTVDPSADGQGASPDKRSFVAREGVKSACFVPIGSRNERLGALFLNFRHPHEFNDLFKFTVESFAQTMAELTSAMRYRELYSDGFGRPELNIHSLLNRHGFKVGGIVSQAEKDLLEANGDGHELHLCPLVKLINDVDEAYREVSVAEAAVPPNFWGVSLRQQLDLFQSSLEKDYGDKLPSIDITVDRQVEKEGPIVRLALYRVITEAITNAIVHGHARDVVVTVQRGPRSIAVRAANDGQLLPEKSREKKGKRGIYYLLQECERHMGADAAGSPKIEGDRTVVELTIPALPQPRGAQEQR